MSLNYVKDPATQVPNLVASGDGIDSVMQYYNDGTDEVKKLLKNECSLIYECSYCRSLFRSIINFIAHKRTICRSLQLNIQIEQLEQIYDQQKAISAINIANKEEGVSIMKKNLRSTKALRRFNPASNLSKHIRPVNVRLERAKADIEIPTLPKILRPTAKTLIVNGKQIIKELPEELSIKQRIPENRVALIIPTKSSIRYGEMQLRSRHNAHSVKKKSNNENKSRELTPEEIAIIERIPSAIPVDFINLRCEDDRCVKNGQLPFKHLAALAHHLAIQHQINYSDEAILKKPNPSIQCFLCDVAPFTELKNLHNHFISVHSAIRKQHIQARLEQISADSSRRKETAKFRFRSLSPISIHEEIIKQGIYKPNEQFKEKVKISNPVLPQLNFTPEEERGQQFAAAFALKNWIEASKQRENIFFSFTKSMVKETTKKGNAEPMSTTDTSKMEIYQKTAGIIPIIDEDEARKIDKLLNCKTPVQNCEKAEANTSNETEEIDEEPTSTSLLIQNRSPRPRRPNKKYEIYEKTENASPINKPNSNEKFNRNGEETILHTSNTQRKHKQLLSKECCMKISKRKKMKINKIASLIDGKKGVVTITSPKVAPPSKIKDFVLPESIKNVNVVCGKETEKQKPQEYSTDDCNESTSQMSPSSNLPEQEVTPARLTKQKLPSVTTDRYKEELVLYTPKARRIMEEQKRSNSLEFSRRKQNLNETLEEGSSISILGSVTSRKEPVVLPRVRTTLPPPKPKDLAQIPVYLTESQRDLFFKPLKTLFNQNVTNDGLCQCGECGEVLKNIKDGRRHMVSHIRVIRVRCSLCDAGAFFCSDMRIHLMYRHCDKLNLAPEEFISNDVPCMDKEKADMLTQLVDPYNPGRIMYTTGKIVSWNIPKAYYPDPKIERNILGPILPGYVASPNSTPKKIRSAILTPKKVIMHHSNQSKEEQTEISKAADKPNTSTASQSDVMPIPIDQTIIGNFSQPQTNESLSSIRVTNVDHDYQIFDALQQQEHIKDKVSNTVVNSANLC